MRTSHINKILVAFLLTVSISQTFASEWNCAVKLEGQWKFSVGDDYDWAKQSYDDSNWDKLYVPGRWEQNYEGYNGYAWYRTTFDVKSLPEKGTIALQLGQIDDVDEVFLNGTKIGQTGSFMPNFKTSYNVDRNYNIPRQLLQKTNNVIAIRVYDSGLDGGIVSGNVGVYYDTDSELAVLDLSGKWKFSISSKNGMLEKNYDDNTWTDILVPASWESQGYPNYDGTAWYRKKFSVPTGLMNENLFLVLGQIDDYDKVYLNGKLLARTENLENFSRYNNNTYRLYRVYELPKSKIETENVLVVEVRDETGDGGIYEGPVGIMTSQKAQLILERNKENYWTNPIRSFFEYFFN